MARYDRRRADAETELDRKDHELDPGPVPDDVEPATPSPVGDRVAADDFGVHLDDPEGDLLDDDLDVGLRDDRAADALDAISETFNARDLDGLLDTVASDGEAPGLLGHDRANLPTAVQDLWERRPTCCLTRGYVGTEHVGVLWEHDGQAWWRVAAVHVNDISDGRVGVLAFSDDTALLDRIVCEGPGPAELEEGARWSEWDEGADGDEAAPSP